jgi:DNA sulfur modification protein DndD
MKFTSISLTNFRQHRDLNLDLRGDRGHFAVIQGRNGAGKTNLLKGITWIITGRLALDEPKFLPESLLSHNASTNAQVGDEIIVHGAIDVDLGRSEARIERQLSFVKKDNGVSFISEDLTITELKDPSTGFVRVADPGLWLDQYLPSRFSHYFLFDGEHLNRFFKETESHYVKQAVLEIANIDQLGKLVDHLDTTVNDLIREAGRNANSDGENLGDAHQRYISRQNEAREKIMVQKDAALELSERIDEVKAKLGDINAIQADIARRDSLEAQADAASQRSAQARIELYSWAMSNAASLFLENALEKTSAEIKQAAADNILPPPFKPDALRELIANEACVCGRELKPSSEACAHIEKVLEKFDQLSATGEMLTKLQEPLYAITSNMGRASKDARAIQDRIKQAVDDEKSATAQYKVLSKKLAGNDDENIAQLSKNFDKYQEDLATANREIGRLEAQEESFAAEAQKYERLIASQASSDEKAKAAQKKISFGQDVLTAARELFIDLNTQIRHEVASNLNEEFQSMIWKKDSFLPVEIDENYRVSVKNNQGFEVRENLSAGETACLAFAFSLTLSKVAGFFYPMVVDSPFGRLDQEVKQFVSDVLSKVLESDADGDSNQLIMLMTDGEYTDSVSEVMAKSDPLVLELMHDEASGETRIGARNG